MGFCGGEMDFFYLEFVQSCWGEIQTCDLFNSNICITYEH